MAYRIEEQVERGELDCRVRGWVLGRLWLAGSVEPVVLRLEGCPWRDLAGHRLEFINPRPKLLAPSHLFSEQIGRVGDITASRKVRVPDCSMEELFQLSKLGQPFPWHWANSLYLEWFSQRNGRVVIESADYLLRIDDEPSWRMTEAEEKEQHRANLEAMNRFFEQIAQAMEQADDPDEDDYTSR